MRLAFRPLIAAAAVLAVLAAAPPRAAEEPLPAGEPEARAPAAAGPVEPTLPPEEEALPPVPVPPEKPPAEAVPPETPPEAAAPAGPAERISPAEARQLRRQLAEITGKLYAEARDLYADNDWDRCIERCDDILKLDPAHLDAQKLKYRAQRDKTDLRLKMLSEESKWKDKEAIGDLDDASNYPDRKPPLARPVRAGEAPPLPLRPHRPPKSPQAVKSDKLLAMEDKLNQRVDINFVDADLDFVLATLFRVTGVNIIADQGALKDKRLTLHVENMPLKEILRFIVRNNQDLSYTVTEDAVWIAAGGANPGMELRVHPLNVGLARIGPVGSSRQQQQQRGRAPGIAGLPMPPQAPPGQGQEEEQEKKNYLQEMLEWLEQWPEYPSGSRWTLDKMASSLLVYTTPEMHEKIDEMLELLDRPPMQVLISTRFVTISENDLRQLGLDFSMQNKPGQDVALAAGSGTDLGVTAGTGLNVVVKGENTDPLFTATLRAMEKDGRGKLLSAPQIITLNNQTGIIDIGTEFYYVNDWREVKVTDVTSGVNPITTERISHYVPVLEKQKISFRLEVTPSVGRDLKTIILELNPDITDVEGGAKQFGTAQIIKLEDDEPPPPTPEPVINNKTLRTRLVVNDGDLVIIGGLMSQETVKSTTKVPILGDIPLLGALFRYEDDNVQKTHLVIVVKAQVIHPTGRGYADAGEAGAGGDDAAIRRPKGPFFTYPEQPAEPARN